MKRNIELNILQAYYEHQTNININGDNEYTRGISLGFKLALYHFGYEYFNLENMEHVYNRLMELKKENK